LKTINILDYFIILKKSKLQYIKIFLLIQYVLVEALHDRMPFIDERCCV